MLVKKVQLVITQFHDVHTSFKIISLVSTWFFMVVAMQL